MRYTASGLLAALVLSLAGCGGTLSSRTAREQVATLAGADIPPSDIQVERVVASTGTRMIAEATIKMAFEFERGPEGEWRIVMARLGDGKWVEIATFLEALEEQRRQETVKAIDGISAGLDGYRDEHGRFPEPPTGGHISDVLHPVFLSELIRQDGWGRPIRYEGGAESYTLRSAGPDGIMGNADDIVQDRGDFPDIDH